MAEFLLLITLMYSFNEIEAQELLPPTVMVDRPVITETDSVTLNCVTPSPVSVTQCDFYIENKEKSDSYSCMQTITGAELLKVTNRMAPAEVKVRCFYTVKDGGIYLLSPRSGESTIIINNLPQALLRVNASVITETDSVTLNCVTPSSVPECFYGFLKENPSKRFSCLKTLTGAELLSLTHQSSPAKVDVTCFYLNSNPSPESNIVTIDIQLPSPELTVNPRLISATDSVTLNCVAPSSVSQCFLYFMGTKISRTISCVQTLRGTELLVMAHQSSPAEVELKCYYAVAQRGGKYFSPNSNICSVIVQNVLSTESTTTPMMVEVSWTPDVVSTKSTTTSTVEEVSWTTDIVETEYSTTVHTPDVSWTTVFGLTDKASTEIKSTLHLTSLPPTTRSEIQEVRQWTHSLFGYWRYALVVLPAFGVVVGVFLLGVAHLCFGKRRSESIYRRSQASSAGDIMFMRNLGSREWLPAVNDEASDMTTSPPAVSASIGLEELKTEESENKNADTYHVYSTIDDEPAPPVTIYSTIGGHKNGLL
ncbi:uncharacterized protein ACNS7B_005709 isoform 2-T2 [Menidia menidia]